MGCDGERVAFACRKGATGTVVVQQNSAPCKDTLGATGIHGGLRLILYRYEGEGR